MVAIFLLYSLYFLRTIIVYIILASVLSLIGRPIMNFLLKFRIGKFRIPVFLCGILTLFSFFLLIFLFIRTFLPLIIEEARLIASLDFFAIAESLSKPLEEVDKFLQQYQLNNDNKKVADHLREAVTGIVSVDNVSNIFSSAFGILGNTFTALFSIIFISFFFLTDEKLLYNFAKNLVPRAFANSFDHVVYTSRNLITRYFIGVLIQITLIATIITIAMFAFGIEYALIIGFFAGFINIIPYVGPLIGMAFGIFVGITTTIDFSQAVEASTIWTLILKIMAAFLLVQFLDNTFFQPYIFSSSIKAHPLEVFLVILVAATVAGIPGMIFSIPIYTVIRVVASELILEFEMFGARRS